MPHLHLGPTHPIVSSPLECGPVWILLATGIIILILKIRRPGA